MAVLQNRKWKFSIYISHTTSCISRLALAAVVIAKDDRDHGDIWRYVTGHKLFYGAEAYTGG